MVHKNPLQQIKQLIPCLPQSDIDLGFKFLQNFDIESLKLLVDSALIRVKKGLTKPNPKEEYLNVNLDNLYKLDSILIDYYSELVPEDIENYIDEEEDNEFLEDYE